ncbi:2Fe-2S iron-sulfur cluster-binding protein [Candidatus Cyanaurora vandensis]|uniref:2Fe-2S iron-sulfur cluster-binding protein n=1 Tax=Candidatus Cyanaurora vandensis TaxID=2714958 RepID=UPI00257DBB01|nr:2Fe-2S iron-sulfur cluster-binding protein [Candidatus Cyanaurora vandensis]
MAAIIYQREGIQVDALEGTNLREVSIGAKVELYKALNKFLCCNGNGDCGTCVVDVVAGEDNLSDRTPAEQRMLARKPKTYRLACQTLINGNATIQTRP